MACTWSHVVPLAGAIVLLSTPTVRADDAKSAPVDEVSVRGRRGAASERSAQAVTVVDLTTSKNEAADLGDVVARRSAVTLQRAGGLGSRTAFSLGGLGGERLRFFLDGVPLELMGYAGGIQNVPVNLLDRVEVFQGVVPIRFGADALGGAVNLVSDENLRRSRFSASYQTGDFGVHRLTGSGLVFEPKTGLVARSSVFYDTADNDYEVDVSAYDANGRTRPVTVPRFHDGYRAGGAQVGVGLVDQTWADRLILSGFVGRFENDIQNGVTMARPFGEVTFARQTSGLNARYALGKGGWRVTATVGYAATNTNFEDISNCLYDWYGRCTPRTPATLRGEINNQATWTLLDTKTVFLRSQLTRELGEQHKLHLSFAPTHADRSGRNRFVLAGIDPLGEPRRLTTGVIGLELESHFFEDRLENSLFVKGYGLVTRSQQLTPTGVWQDMSRDIFRGGGGDSLRFRIARPLYAKASYEYAMRQPSVDELFGDGMLTLDNLALRPETSHNANLGLTVEDVATPVGSFRGSVLGFSRWSDDLIALIANSEFLRSYNVWEARALGVDAALGWSAPGGDWFSIDGRVTYQDLRNTSSEGLYASQDGDRIPNIPYLISNATARLRTRGLVTPKDRAELGWHVRYVHEFHRGWESLATRAQRLVIESQLSHSALLTYAIAGEKLAIAMTLEAQNITNEKLYDFYGVQRPGRAFFTKWTLDY